MDEVSAGRIYDAPTDAPGHRVLIDRLWPRGIRKDDPRFDLWVPEVAPSDDLRGWYGHDPEKFEEFVQRYHAELDGNPAVERILSLDGPVALLTATRDVELSHAAVLRDHLREDLELDDGSP